VALFVTCLGDVFYPEVGEATVRLLHRLGIAVDFPRGQTCCGQPAFNAGFRQPAKDVARRNLVLFANAEYIIVPSGSCAAMWRVFYPELFADDPVLGEQAEALAARTYELAEFLVHVVGVERLGAVFHGKVTYHASCHLLRELGISEQPRRLIRAVRDVDFVEMEAPDTCCGFGGTFSVKFGEISNAILQEKLARIENSGVEYVVANDSSCLMQIAGGLSRAGSPVKTMHLAELLAKQ